MKLTTVSCPCVSADPCQIYQSRELKTGEKQLFSYYDFILLFFFFRESLKMFLNSKKYTHIIFNKWCKNEKKKRKKNKNKKNNKKKQQNNDD